MSQYSIDQLRKHWAANTANFQSQLPVCHALFKELADFGSLVASALTGRKELEANCVYLLFAKSLNHAFSALLLLERGLIVDSALSTRNALESLLLLELLVKRPELCASWAQGDEFRPAEVRRQLSELQTVAVRDVVISVTRDEYDDAKFAYSWLSRITHANLESLQHSATSDGPDSFVVHIGGAHSETAAVAIAAVLGSAFLRAGATAVSAYAVSVLQQHGHAFDRLKERTAALTAKRGA